METDDSSGRSGMVRWAMWRLITAPAAWLGALAGTAAGAAIVSSGTPLGGGVGFGAMLGAGVAATALALQKVVQRGFAEQTAGKAKTAENERAERERATLEKLRAAGLTDDGSVLERMIEARNAIVQHSARADVGPERSGPTLGLVAEILRTALLRTEELLDLKRRTSDPLLDTPQDAASRMADCQGDLVRAYRAVADCRTRMLLHRELSPDELLEETRGVADGGIRALTARLEEETAILRGVERRMSQRAAQEFPADETDDRRRAVEE